MHHGHGFRNAWLVSSLLSVLACESDGGVDQSEDPSTACECPVTLEVNNTALCGAESDGDTPPIVFSSTYVENAAPTCGPGVFPPPVPQGAWGTAVIQSKCAGAGKLCFDLKQGDKDSPTADDCVLASQCVDFDYAGGDVPLALPSFGGWAATDQACLYKYEADGGYFEFRIEGTGVGCTTDEAPTPTLRIRNCPLSCGADPSSAECVACLDEASGESVGSL